MPGKRLDLVPLHSSGNLERGLKFVLMSERDADGEGDSEEGEAMSVESIGGASGSEEEEEEEDSKARRDRRQRKEGISPAGKRHIKSTEELSGGQRALLGLSFVFACALHKTSPLYLLDEVRRSAVQCSLSNCSTPRHTYFRREDSSDEHELYMHTIKHDRIS